MLRTVRSLARLTRAARVLGTHDALFPLELREEMPRILLALMPLAKIRLPWDHSRGCHRNMRTRVCACR